MIPSRRCLALNLFLAVFTTALLLPPSAPLSPFGAWSARAETSTESTAVPAKDHTKTATTNKAGGKQAKPAGYLPAGEGLDSKAFLPPPPSETSALKKTDDAWHARMLKLRGTARWEAATADANLTFPAAANIFSCALGIPVTEQGTPALYRLLARSMADIKGTASAAKRIYRRVRPFLTDDTPVCTPGKLDRLRLSYSYPSGHAAVGWGWALILTELAPDRSGAILQRGFTFGESRTVCNVHWYSDIVASRMIAAATVAVLHANAAFREGLEAAKADIATARASGAPPQGNCSVEIKELTDAP